MFKPHHALEGQLLRHRDKAGNADAITEHIMDGANIDGLGGDGERKIQNVLVETLARPKHHAMLAERHRLGVAIAGQMANGQNIHAGSANSDLKIRPASWPYQESRACVTESRALSAVPILRTFTRSSSAAATFYRAHEHANDSHFEARAAILARLARHPPRFPRRLVDRPIR